MKHYYSSNCRSGVKSDEAVATSLDPDVALLSPGSTPRVTDDPVFNSVFISETNCSRCMIVLSADTIENSTSVRHEFTLGLKINTDRAILNNYLCISDSIDIVNDGKNGVHGGLAKSQHSHIRI
jgi:hypothetical protein